MKERERKKAEAGKRGLRVRFQQSEAGILRDRE